MFPRTRTRSPSSAGCRSACRWDTSSAAPRPGGCARRRWPDADGHPVPRTNADPQRAAGAARHPPTRRIDAVVRLRDGRRDGQRNPLAELPCHCAGQRERRPAPPRIAERAAIRRRDERWVVGPVRPPASHHRQRPAIRDVLEHRERRDWQHDHSLDRRVADPHQARVHRKRKRHRRASVRGTIVQDGEAQSEQVYALQAVGQPETESRSRGGPLRISRLIVEEGDLRRHRRHPLGQHDRILHHPRGQPPRRRSARGRFWNGDR